MKKYRIIIILLWFLVPNNSYGDFFILQEGVVCIDNTRPSHEILSLYPSIKDGFCEYDEILDFSIPLDDIILDYHYALEKYNQYMSEFISIDPKSKLSILYSKYSFLNINLGSEYEKKYKKCVSNIDWSERPYRKNHPYSVVELSKTPFSKCTRFAYNEVYVEFNNKVEEYENNLKEKEKLDIINRPLSETDTSIGNIKGNQCASDLILHQNLKAPNSGYVRNGAYHWYTKAVVREAHILQKHLNRLGFNSGKVDGVIGPLTKGAILRLQKHLNTKQDGYIGPITRSLLNHSC